MNTDKLMVDTWLSLLQDFRSIAGKDFLRAQEIALRDGIKTFRDVHFPGRMQAPPQLHRQIYQMEGFFKRYIFENDEFTTKDLREKACLDFTTFQRNLAAPRPDLRLSTYIVVQKARRLIREVLGPYDINEHMRLCRFGKRAVVGVPGAKAFLDEKIRNMSCSQEQLSWFQLYLKSDNILQDAINETNEKHPYDLVSCLKLVNVPKKYNTLRSIMPNTGLGAFITAGLGKYLELRLRQDSCDIRKLQDDHKRLAQLASKTRHLVTLDLRKASENFTSAIVNRFLPRSWYNVHKMGRVSHASVGARECYLSSFMAMGIGYTFPLQTLIYRSVIKAIALLVGVDPKGVSVYGDDCIYPRKLHKYVIPILSDLGFEANSDKTFVHHFFRESCGGDYYHGVDVRPYCPEGFHQVLYGVKLEAFLYKTLNGLLRRWSTHEIPRTVYMLLRHIAGSCGRVYQVPTHFPDTAGVKVDMIQNAWEIPWSPVHWSAAQSNFVFTYLQKLAKDRLVRSCYPYYWNAHRISSLSEDENDEWTPWDESPVEQLRWVDVRPYKYYTSKFTKKRYRKTVAVVASKVEFRYKASKGETLLGKWHID